MNNPTQEACIKRKLYCSPEIIHEFELETRAGSPLGEIEMIDTHDFITAPDPGKKLLLGGDD